MGYLIFNSLEIRSYSALNSMKLKQATGAKNYIAECNIVATYF